MGMMMSNVISCNAMLFLKNKLYIAVMGGLLATVLTIIMLSNGVSLSADGWAYWEGSVSLLYGNGYEYFGGQNITGYPPLFSVLLSVFQSVVGVSGFSIAIFTAIISGITAFTWIYLFLTISNDENTTIANILLISIYMVTFISANFTALLAETFSLFLIGVSLLLIVKLSDDSYSKQRAYYLLMIVFSALLLTKNSNISLFPGYFFVIVSLIKGSNSKRLVVGLLLTSVPTILWMVTKYFLGQTKKHPIVFAGNYSITEYMGQFAHSMSNFLGPSIIGMMLLVTLLILIITLILLSSNKNSCDKILMRICIIVSSGAVCLFVLFNIVWIGDKFSGRFLWALPLTLVGTLSVLYSWERNVLMRNIIIALLALISLIQVERTTKHVLYRLQGHATPNILLNYTINPDYYNGSNIQKGGSVLVAPPEFHWVNRGNELN